MQNVKNCLICGVGGQGTVLSSRLLAGCAISRGMQAVTAETIGMAQRGGCVVSHVRIGENIKSPLISEKTANVLIAFEPAEAVRCLNYLKDDGLLVVSDKGIMPVSASLSGGYNPNDMLEFLKKNVKNLIVVKCNEVYEKLASSKVLNVVLLGVAIELGKLNVKIEDLEKVLSDIFANEKLTLNLKALEISKGLSGRLV